MLYFWCMRIVGSANFDENRKNYAYLSGDFWLLYSYIFAFFFFNTAEMTRIEEWVKEVNPLRKLQYKSLLAR